MHTAFSPDPNGRPCVKSLFRTFGISIVASVAVCIFLSLYLCVTPLLKPSPEPSDFDAVGGELD